MPVVKHCVSCGTKLINKRSHARHCSASCRSKSWREQQEQTIPVKLRFKVTHFELIKNAAETNGVSVNEYIHDRVDQTEHST